MNKVRLTAACACTLAVCALTVSACKQPSSAAVTDTAMVATSRVADASAEVVTADVPVLTADVIKAHDKSLGEFVKARVDAGQPIVLSGEFNGLDIEILGRAIKAQKVAVDMSKATIVEMTKPDNPPKDVPEADKVSTDTETEADAAGKPDKPEKPDKPGKHPGHHGHKVFKANTIPAGAFAHTGIASIVLPESVTAVDKGAFAKCRNLASVTIGANVEGVEKAFSKSFAKAYNASEKAAGTYTKDGKEWVAPTATPVALGDDWEWPHIPGMPDFPDWKANLVA